MTVEAELEQEKDARSLFDAWHEKPQDPVLGAELKASLESIKQDADLVDEPWLSTTAKRALALLDQAPADAGALSDLSTEMQQISPAASCRRRRRPLPRRRRRRRCRPKRSTPNCWRFSSRKPRRSWSPSATTSSW